MMRVHKGVICMVSFGDRCWDYFCQHGQRRLLPFWHLRLAVSAGQFHCRRRAGPRHQLHQYKRQLLLQPLGALARDGRLVMTTRCPLSLSEPSKLCDFCTIDYALYTFFHSPPPISPCLPFFRKFGLTTTTCCWGSCSQ